MTSDQLIIDKRAFKGKGAQALGQQALILWNGVTAEARSIAETIRPVLVHLPYRVIVDVRRGEPPSLFVRWLHGGKSVVWHDIQEDARLTKETRSLLSHYNTQLEELMSYQRVLREVLAETHRIGKVQRGETYNMLTKGRRRKRDVATTLTASTTTP